MTFLSILSLFCFSLMPTVDQPLELKIAFSGEAKAKAELYFQIKDEQGKVVAEKVLDFESGQRDFKIELSPGRYAVAAFVDENGNGEIDFNFAGFPTEAYGFSNNLRPRFSRPSLEEQLFSLEENRAISIRLK